MDKISFHLHKLHKNINRKPFWWCLSRSKLEN